MGLVDEGVNVEDVENSEDKRNKVLSELHLHKHGSIEFLHLFDIEERSLFPNCNDVVVLENGYGLDQMKNLFKLPHLCKSTSGLGLVVPEIEHFKDLKKIININLRVTLIDSTTQGTCNSTIMQILKSIEKDEQRANLKSKFSNKIFNCLSFEMEQNGLGEIIRVPLCVQQNSLISRIKQKAQNVLERLDGKSVLTSDETVLQSTTTRIINKLPKFEKFLLISQRGSFTDVHVDQCASAVFYHVIKGRKIFYVAPPTKDNLEQYRKYETGENSDWIVQTLRKDFKRVEIEEGWTMILPSGYVHFVYTPENSIVVGGNFLLEENLSMHFDLARVEQKSLDLGFITVDNLMSNFHDSIFAFTKFCILSEEKPVSTSTLKQAEMILRELSLKIHSNDDIFTAQQRADILDGLEKFIARNRRMKRKFHGDTEPADRLKLRKYIASTNSTRKVVADEKVKVSCKDLKKTLMNQKHPNEIKKNRNKLFNNGDKSEKSSCTLENSKENEKFSGN